MKTKLFYLAVAGSLIFTSCESNEYSTEDVDSTTMIVPGVSVDSGKYNTDTTTVDTTGAGTTTGMSQ